MKTARFISSSKTDISRQTVYALAPPVRWGDFEFTYVCCSRIPNETAVFASTRDGIFGVGSCMHAFSPVASEKDALKFMGYEIL